MLTIERVYGEVKRIGEGEFILAAPRDAPDGIGCALGIMPWDGRYTVIETERIESWGAESWRDYWAMFPLEAGKLYPFAYFRCTATVAEWGEVRGGKPEDQIILGSMRRPGAAGRQHRLCLSATEGTVHIGWGADTLSLRIRNSGHLAGRPGHYGRLGHYCEASIVKVKVTQGGRS